MRLLPLDKPALTLRTEERNEQKQPEDDKKDIFQVRLQQVSRVPLRNSGDFLSDLSTPEDTAPLPSPG